MHVCVYNISYQRSVFSIYCVEYDSSNNKMMLNQGTRSLLIFATNVQRSSIRAALKTILRNQFYFKLLHSTFTYNPDNRIHLTFKNVS